jgi:hypothetical protein
MRRQIAAAVLASGFVALGCSTLAVDRIARNEDIAAPWRAEPLSVDLATVAAAEEACRDARVVVREEVGPVDRLVAIDARGDSRLTLIFAGPGKASMECQLVMDAKGNMSMTGGVVQDVPALLVGPGELVIVASGGMTGHVDDSSALGQVGSAISDVHVVFDSGAVVRASVGSGWFTAWWPAHDMAFVVRGLDASGRQIAEVKR